LSSLSNKNQKTKEKSNCITAEYNLESDDHSPRAVRITNKLAAATINSVCVLSFLAFAMGIEEL
jgi:hypothetical protein